MVQFRLIFLTIVALLLTSCSPQLTYSWRGQPLTAEQHLSRAKQATDANVRASHLAMGIEQLIWQGRFQAAQRWLADLPAQASYLAHMIRAQSSLLAKQPARAWRYLSLVKEEDRSMWPVYWQARYHHWRVCATQQMGDVGRNLLEYEHLLQWMAAKGYDLEDHLLGMWAALPSDRALVGQVAQDNPDVSGWLALNQVVRSWPYKADTWFEQLADWRESHPNHLANRLFALSIPNIRTQQVHVPKRMALFLPLHGSYASVGHALRNGFLAAYYQSRKQLNQRSVIRVFDTSTMDVGTAYQTAVSWGADFVVGPLQQDNVQAIADLNERPVPVLALNKARDAGQYDGLYHFGLFPEDEAAQIADRIVRQHKRFVIAIAPKGGWGERVIEVFRDALQEKGGVLMDTLYLDDDKRFLTAQLKAILRVDLAEDRLKRLQNLSDTTVKFMARRRQDIDAVLLAASADQQERIAPLLRFFYMEHLPIYLVPQSGSLAAYRSHDLDQILFSGMPWFAKQGYESDVPLDALRKRVKQVWKQSHSYQAAFYAMGIDAYYLLWYWPRLQLLPQIGIHGATGQLYLEHHQIHRRLLWSKIDKQTPVVVGPSCLESFS